MAYFKQMNLGRLFQLLVLLALLLAPAGMLGSHAAMAMPHQAAASALDHCTKEQAPSGTDRQAMLDCALACTAMPAAAPQIARAVPVLQPLPVSVPEAPIAGHRPEAATPPPRFS